MAHALSNTASPPVRQERPWVDPLAAFAALEAEAFALLLHDGRNGRARIFVWPEETVEGFEAAAFQRFGERFRDPASDGLWAGLLGYDLATAFEQVETPAPLWPVIAMGRYTHWAEFDRDAARYVVHAPDAAGASRLIKTLEAAAIQQPAPQSPARWAARWPQARYLDAARRAVDYVHAGDVFQVNLAQVFDAGLGKGDTPLGYFTRLCGQSPAPHAAYLRLDDERVVLTNSPERFLSVRDGEVEARPIKGTRPRRSDPAADQAEIDALSASAKDRAENLMIVDLMRNDLSRVCRPGSVAVPVLCEVESYANVHHLVSVVRGQLNEDRDLVDLIAASFPPGSITGAPKVRAMEIIAELEGEPRGPYCGALGWLSRDGNMDLNVMIRTAALRREPDGWTASIRSGGGIVADSEPLAEYEETLAKASALKAALGRLA